MTMATMGEWIGMLNGVITVVAFVAFLCIVRWATNPRRKAQFDAAANAPFALPDEPRGDNAGPGVRR